ncbi:MAG: hypothetical protein NTV72_00930 [Candidatus Taylorbacteria bacterium]|nr:hypothetical protein [Candidatus Taylorbacteria bacterium]
MDTTIKFKVLTIISNSKIKEEQKKVLEAYIETLSDANLAKLITIFGKYPTAIPVYADYVKELGNQNQPVTMEKLEEIILPLLNNLS